MHGGLAGIGGCRQAGRPRAIDGVITPDAIFSAAANGDFFFT